MTGIAKAPVFPEPVRAWASTSLPSRARGIARSWIGVGLDQPSVEMACNSCKRVLSIHNIHLRTMNIELHSSDFHNLFLKHLDT